MKDISNWFAETCLQFAQQENTNPCRSASDFLQRLTKRRMNFQAQRIPVWTPARVNLVQHVNNKVSRAVDFWTTCTLEAFVTEFAIDTSTSFSEAERQFFKGPRGKFLNLLGLRIKILLAEKGILLFESDY